MGSNIYQDRLEPDDIWNSLPATGFVNRIICLDTVDSTNEEAKRRAEAEAEAKSECTLILSEEQTAGRGRQGRGWISPKGKGIWLSAILRPQIIPVRVPQLTQIAAAAICLGLERENISGLQVKWPNDILVGGRKLCGILTEMQSRGNKVEHVILGIGVNVNLREEDFPEELKSEATSLYLETGRIWERAPLIAGMIEAFEPLYRKYIDDNDMQEAIDICRQRSAVLGKRVLLHERGLVRSAQALNLGPQGELLVRLEDGQITPIVSGEISVRVMR